MLTAKRSMENARPCPCAGTASATAARTIAATPRSRRLTRASRADNGFALCAARKGPRGPRAILGAVELDVPALDEPEDQRDLVGREAVDRRVQVRDQIGPPLELH